MSRFTVHLRYFKYKFTQIKVKNVGMPQSVKELSLSLQNVIVMLVLS